jgi:multiple sugar transport system substrate-binding protein
MADARVSRRQVLKAAAATGVATTSPWWLVNKSHAQRAKKIVYWHIPNFTPKADDLQKEQVYEFAKQAGVKEGEVEYAVVANEQVQAKLAASIEAGNPPDVTRLYESNVQFYAGGGHLLDLTDVVDKMKKEPKGIFESALVSVVYKGRAMGAPLAVNPWPVHARLDLLEKAKVDYPKTWDEFIETSKKIQDPPRLFAFGLCLGLVEDTTDNVMNLLWCYGGKMVEADNKTVVMNSPENVAGVKVIEAMFKTHKIIAPGSISWDNSGNNKAYQSKQAAFVMNPTSVYAYLDGNDKDLQKATGLFPVPAGPKGTVNQIDTWAFGAFKKNPYPELAKGLVEYLMRPDNYDKIIQSTGGRWVPVYKRLFDSPFWKEKPAFKHFIQMAETGVPVSYAGAPTPAAGEVLNTQVVPKMIQRVLVENWAAEKALEESHKKIAEIYDRHNKG